MSLSTTAISCYLDDFAKTFEDWEQHHLLPTGRKHCRSGKLCLSEMLSIMVLFHLSPFKDFKHFWHYGVEQKYRGRYCTIPNSAQSLPNPDAWHHKMHSNAGRPRTIIVLRTVMPISTSAL